MLSVVTTFNRNDVSAAESNDQIKVLLERLIQKVDALENVVRTVVSKLLRADATYNAMSKEVKKHNITVEDVSRALQGGYHFVGNGYAGNSDDHIAKHPLSFSQCVDMCSKKMHDAGDKWNSFYWRGYDNYCVCCKGERGHTPNTRIVHFRI